MSSEPRRHSTVVPEGITDPVQRARAELKAALAAIEVKGNLPRRAAEATSRTVADLKRNPPLALAVAGAAALAVGGAVWGITRLITR